MKKAFTLVELMIVSTIMIIVGGIIYTFYMNLTRVYHRGSKALLQVQDSQIILELLSRELRSASELIKFSPQTIVFQKFYDEVDPNKEDPVTDLNKIRVKTVHFRVVQDRSGYYRFQRKEELEPFKAFQPGFASKFLDPNVFRAWALVGEGYVPYLAKFGDPSKIPLMEIRLNLRDPSSPLVLFKKVFLPAPFGRLPVLKLPEWARNES
jgi:competence protein ComGC